MTKKKKKEILKNVITKLKALFPKAKIQLSFDTAHQLLIATILSAQCTDERVNKVTSELFKKYKNPEDFATIPLSKLEQLIYSTGYYKAKAKHIKEMSKILMDKYNGEVPATMDELLTLPGVGRKTANVILGHIFDQPAIVVDTHVIKIMNRLDICNTRNAGKIERELMELIPSDDWVLFTHLMINFGRSYCTARSPKCTECPIVKYCRYVKK